MDKDTCPFCKTSYDEIKATGFVGCQHCYFEIEKLNEIIKALYKGNKYKGRKPGEGANGDI